MTNEEKRPIQLEGKTPMSVGTIGHVDHGKTTLTAAISLVQAHRHGGKAKDYAAIDGAPEEQKRGITINASHLRWASDSRVYAHVDCPGHHEYVKGMITGAAQMDGAILLVDGSQGTEAQTREHVVLARQVGVEHLVVFVNKVDIADAELLELVELEVGELLESYGYVDTPIVRGSALKALEAAQGGRFGDEAIGCIDALVEALDTHVPAPERDEAGPFLMPVEGVYAVKGLGTVVTGRVERGRLVVGDSVQIVGGETVAVKGIQAFHEDLPAAVAGHNVGLLLRGVHKDAVARGDVMAAPGSVQPHAFGEADLVLLQRDEGGRHTPIKSGYMPQLWFGVTDVTATLTTAELLEPGARGRVRFELQRPVALESGMRFAIREGGRTVGAGVVRSVE
ncbi:MAG: elongation factor Tu [Deltaproteobacteria bacterium]|nr:elongation factor Tu [Deltaproteobacteria bacterium]